MYESKWIAITLAVLLCAGSFALGQEEGEKPAGPKRMMRHHLEALSKHGEPGGMGKRRACLGCRFMMMNAPSPVEALLENEAKLELTEKQMDTLSNMEFEFEIAQIDRHAALQKSIIKLHRVFEAEPIDTSMLEEALQGSADIGIEMIIGWVETSQEAMGVLTDEQKQVFEGIGEERRARMEMRPGEGERRGT
jgi:Spy/CpxP family protein refolding chaperone